jgi:formylglycine-generating enzyme required for sulfatase activity
MCKEGNFLGCVGKTTPVDGDQDLGVWRGGSWGSKAEDVRVTTRRPQNRDHSSYKAGFRVAKTL